MRGKQRGRGRGSSSSKLRWGPGRPAVAARGSKDLLLAQAELRPFLQAPGLRRERGRGRPVTGADVAGEGPFLGAAGRLRAAAVLAPNHAQGLGG